MPKTPGIFTDIHNMTMLTNAAAIKSNTERFPELMRSFSIEFKNDKSGIILSSQAAELVHEVTELLGMEVLESKVAHARPYTFSMKVRALPQAVVFCGLRFSRLGLTVKELPEAK